MEKNPNEDVEIQRSREAEFLLNNPMLSEALEAMERSYEGQWRNTRPNQTEEREAAYRMIDTIKLFRTLLTRFIETGTLAETSKVQRREQERLEAMN